MAGYLQRSRQWCRSFLSQILQIGFRPGLFLVSPLAHRPGILAITPTNIPKSTKHKCHRFQRLLKNADTDCHSPAIGHSCLHNSGIRLFNRTGSKPFNQKATAALANGQSFYLYNTLYLLISLIQQVSFSPTYRALQLFISSLPQGSSYVGCYVDGNGTTHTYTSSLPNIVEVSGQSVLVNGHSHLLVTNPILWTLPTQRVMRSSTESIFKSRRANAM